MAYLVPEPKMQFFDDNGDPLSGGKVYTYEAGTTTPILTYTTEAATTPNSNPVILDAAGRAQIWISNTEPQRWILKTSADVQIWDVDMIGADALAYAVLRSDSFTGDGSDLTFTLSYEPRSLLNAWVSINGLTQTPTTDYTISGMTLTFVVAPPNLSQIFVKYAQNQLWSDDYALAGPLADSGITGAAASGANTDITSLANYTVVGYQRDAATVTVASATSTAIGAAASNNVDISGTTTITSFDTVADGVIKRGRFTGILTLTHNATSLILPGASNITTAANDRYEARSLGSGNWLVLDYTKANGQPVSNTITVQGTKCTMVGNTASLSASTPVVMAWDAEQYDDGGWHDVSSNNSRITVPSTARYSVFAGINFNFDTGGTYTNDFNAIVTIKKNGVALVNHATGNYYYPGTFVTGGTNVGQIFVQFQDEYNLTASDYLEVFINPYFFAGTVTVLAASSFFLVKQA